MIEVSNLSKTYPGEAAERRTALKDVSLSLSGGEILCLLGPNGSGKTTLMKVLAGLVLPEKGRVRVAGFELPKVLSQAQAVTGFSPGEERSFYGRLSCLENLRFFAALRGLGEAELSRRLSELEQALELRELLGLEYQKTSAGMKQRLSLARALLHRPSVLLLDEPTKSLDPGGAERLKAYVAREYRGRKDRAVLWSTHRVEEAWEAGTVLLLLRRGEILRRGTPSEILRASGGDSPKQAYLRLSGEEAP